MKAFVGLPRMTVMSAACAPFDSPKCSAVTRRTALHIACITVSAALLPPPANAVSLYEKKVIKNIGVVSLAVEKANTLKATVEQWNQPLSEEDGLIILRYIPIWLEPGRVAMAAVGSQQEVDVGDRNDIKHFADALLGHLFELKAEAKGGRKDGIIRELDEFVETTEAFLSISQLQKLKKR